jgi:ribosomal protein L24
MTHKHNNRVLEIGDQVRVIRGTKDPDFGTDIGGWQGSVFDISGDVIGITLDGVTLADFSNKYIAQCEQEGLDWEKIYLYPSELEFARSRTTDDDTRLMQQKIMSESQWDHLGEAGKRIGKILSSTQSNDESAQLDTWEKYLEKFLVLPFDGKITDCQDRGALQAGDKIKVQEILGNEELYGVLVQLIYGRKVYHFPLCCIEATDKATENNMIVTDYSIWFVNR